MPPLSTNREALRINRRPYRLWLSLTFGVAACSHPTVPAQAPEGHQGGTQEEEAPFSPPSMDSPDNAPSGPSVGPSWAETPTNGSQLDPAVLACPQVFAEQLRSTWQNVGGEDYYIDASGRPAQVHATIPPFEDEMRDETCQLDVGHWGDDGADANDYDGGHLLANQLGGAGTRINLVPQVASFNRGNWAQLENALRDCEDDLAPGRLELLVTATYASKSDVVPTKMAMTIADVLDPSVVLHVEFENADRGGTTGLEEHRRGVAWLRSLGCRN